MRKTDTANIEQDKIQKKKRTKEKKRADSKASIKKKCVHFVNFVCRFIDLIRKATIQ